MRRSGKTKSIFLVVQQLVCLALEQSFVEGHNHGVLVGLLDDGQIVGIVDALGTGGLGAVAGSGRLAATHDAAAAAGHDLDEVVVDLSGLDLLHDLAGMNQAADDANAQGPAVVIELEGLNGIVAANAAFRDGVQSYLVVLRNQTAQHCLGNATGDAEDDAAAGTEAEGYVAGLRRQAGEINAGVADHADQLRGGDDNIRILLALGEAVGPLGLHLLGGTGHDGDHHRALALGVLGIAIPLLDQSGHHALGRTAGGQILLELRILIGNELDPGGAAGGQQRQFDTSFHTVEELGGLLHNRQVGGERSVVDLVEAQAVQDVDDFAHNALAALNAEGVAHGHTDGGGYLSHHTDLGITQSFPNLVGVGVDADGAGGAVDTALAAVDAEGLCNLLVEGGHHHGVGAAEGEAQCADALELVAGADTVAAEDALVGIADDGGGAGVHLVDLSGVGKADLGDAQTVGQHLQITFAALDAGGAVAAVGGQQQLQNQLAVALDAAGVGENHHAVPGLLGAGGKGPAAVILHGTQTAGAEGGNLGVIAQGGDIDTGVPNNAQHIFFIGKLDFPSVNGHSSHV